MIHIILGEKQEKRNHCQKRHRSIKPQNDKAKENRTPEMVWTFTNISEKLNQTVIFTNFEI